RHPEKVKPPHRIDKKFSNPECPGLSKRNQPGPLDEAHSFLRVAADVIQFRFGESSVLLRLLIKHQPKHEPDKANRADAEECAARPTPRPLETRSSTHDQCRTCAKAESATPEGERRQGRRESRAGRRATTYAHAPRPSTPTAARGTEPSAPSPC